MQAIHEGAYAYGGAYEVAYGEGACYLDAADPVQAAAGCAAALATVWGAAEDAWFDASLEIGGIIRGHLREETILWILWRM